MYFSPITKFTKKCGEVLASRTLFSKELKRYAAGFSGFIDQIVTEEQKGSAASSFQPKVLELFLVWVLSFCPFAWAALERFIARDEGYYLYAAQLVARLEIPYLDFFYPQMPYLPYLLAPFSSDWETARLFMAVISAACSVVIYLLSPTRKSAVFAALLFVSCHFVFCWYVTVQTYSLSALFLLLSLACLLEPTKFRLVLSGALFALTCSVRLFFGPVILVLLALVTLRSKAGERLRSLRHFIAGGLLASVPLLVLLFADYEAFYFNNLEYHFDRSLREDSQEWNKKRIVSLIAFGLRETQKFDGPQLAILLWSSLFFSLLALYRRRLPSPFLLAAFLMFIISLLPNPTYVQYFAVLIPFLIVGCVQEWDLLAPGLRSFTAKFALVVLLPLYLWFVPVEVDQYFRSANGVIGVSSKFKADWKLSRLAEVRDQLAAYPISENAISFWPGYFVGTDHRLLMGLENQFSLPAGKRVENPKRFKLAERESILEAVRTGAAETLVFHSQIIANRRKLREEIKKQNYQRVAVFGGVEIYRKV